MYILKTWDGSRWVDWTRSASPSNINKLIGLHERVKPGVPYMVDRVK